MDRALGWFLKEHGKLAKPLVALSLGKALVDDTAPKVHVSATEMLIAPEGPRDVAGFGARGME